MKKYEIYFSLNELFLMRLNIYIRKFCMYLMRFKKPIILPTLVPIIQQLKNTLLLSIFSFEWEVRLKILLAIFILEFSRDLHLRASLCHFYLISGFCLCFPCQKCKNIRSVKIVHFLAQLCQSLLLKVYSFRFDVVQLEKKIFYQPPM